MDKSSDRFVALFRRHAVLLVGLSLACVVAVLGLMAEQDLYRQHELAHYQSCLALGGNATMDLSPSQDPSGAFRHGSSSCVGLRSTVQVDTKVFLDSFNEMHSYPSFAILRWSSIAGGLIVASVFLAAWMASEEARGGRGSD